MNYCSNLISEKRWRREKEVEIRKARKIKWEKGKMKEEKNEKKEEISMVLCLYVPAFMKGWAMCL